MPDTFSLSTKHLNSKDRKVLGSLLELSAGREGAIWEIVAGDDADAILVDVDDPEGQAVWSGLENGEVPAIALTERRDFHAWLVLRKPLRSQVLFRTLERVLEELENPVSADDWPVLDFGDMEALPLAEHLRLHTWAQPVLLKGEDAAELVIDPGAGVWYFAGSDRELTALLLRKFAARDGRILSSSGLLDHTNGLNQNNLAALKWRAGIALSGRALHPDLAGPIKFRLPQVPLQALSDTAYSRQARLLTQQALTVRGLIEASQAEPGDVATFLNASHVCGYLLIQRQNS